MRLFYRMTWIALVLSIAMTILSAYIRLADSGIGCAPWPACFAEQFVVDPQPGIAIAEADPRRGFRVTHRVMASAFAVVILVMTVYSLWYRSRLGVSPVIPVFCFVLTVVLSIVGINTPDIAHPVVTGINLTGGMVLAALLLHLLLLQQGPGAPGHGSGRVITLVGVWFLVLVVASGSWVSGNFAAGQFHGLLACTYPFEAEAGDAFDLSRELEIVDGRIIVDESQAMIAYAHQWLALWATAIVVVIAGTVLVKVHAGRARVVAVTAAVLVLVLTLLGIMEAGAPSLLTASLHNTLALALLLVLIYLYNQLSEMSPND